MFPLVINQARRFFPIFLVPERPLLLSYVALHQGVRHYSKGKPKGRKGDAPKTLLRDEELAEVLNFRNFRSQLEKSIQNLGETYLKQLNITNAAGGLSELTFEFENTNVTLSEVAQIQRKPNLVVLQFAAFPEAIKPAIKAVESSGMHLGIQQEGTTVYLQFAKVTREQREALAKNAKTLFQKCKDHLLQVERKTTKEIQNHGRGQSEDLIFNAKQQVKFEIEQTLVKAESMMKAKQKELLAE